MDLGLDLSVYLVVNKVILMFENYLVYNNDKIILSPSHKYCIFAKVINIVL